MGAWKNKGGMIPFFTSAARSPHLMSEGPRGPYLAIPSNPIRPIFLPPWHQWATKPLKKDPYINQNQPKRRNKANYAAVSKAMAYVEGLGANGESPAL